MDHQSRTIPKKLRFDVFKRDHFTCLYCGRTPPTVTLEIDHILAFSKGGQTVIENLATSCRDCNAGDENRAVKYFCGICWKKIKDREETGMGK